MTIQQTLESALQHHQSGRLAQAEGYYRQILAVQPNHADALHLLGLISHQVGRSDLAIDLIGRAVTLQPDFPEGHCHLGNILKDEGQLDRAIAAYHRAIAFRPDFAEAHCNLGVALKSKGRLDEAIAAYRQAIALKPDYPEAYGNLGNALTNKGQLDEAIVAYRRSIALEPDFPENYINLGNAVAKKGQLDEAIATYHRAIALKPDYPEAYGNLGNELTNKGQLDKAIAAYRRSIALKPDYSEAHANLGNALKNKGLLDEAIAAYRRAVALKPNRPEAHCNFGITLKDKGQLDEAVAALQQAIALEPNYPEAHLALAMALLGRGDFSSGWEEYEWRWQLKDESVPQRNFIPPRWDGTPLAGRTILLHAEQGFGDTLQSIRYAPLVAQRGGRVIVECQPGLETLLESVEGITQIIPHGEPLPAFDVHCPLMSLPRAFGTQLETIPADLPYLQVDSQKAARWRERLDQEKSAPGEPARWRDGPLKVGLVWAGASRPRQPIADQIDRWRSMSLRQFAPLAGLPGVVFISLQKGAPAEQARTPPAGMRLLDWTDELDDFAETAALVESLDLVISVDTSVVHLAGALGKPVWVLNRFDSCWRWLRDRTDSPWYPTARLFRQPQPMEWEPVMAELREQLQLLVQSRTEKP